MRTREDSLRDAALLYRFHADCGEAPEKADLILAAGSHDLRVPRHAAGLFLAGLAPWLMCTGGLGKITEGLWSEPEAVIFARECRALGVPEERLLLEDRSTNTGENFRFGRELLLRRGIPAESGVIVCKPYMSMRCLHTAQKQWPELRWYVNAPKIPFAEYADEGCPLEQEIQLMTGDLQRLRVYAELGYQTPVEIPEEVWRAYERLAADGYDRYVMR